MLHHISENPPVKLVHYALRALLATRRRSEVVEGPAPSTSTEKYSVLYFSAPVRWRGLTDDAEEWSKDQHRGGIYVGI